MCGALLSQAYADPAARGKLKALAGLGVSVVAAVPERWIRRGCRRPRRRSSGTMVA